MVKFFHAAKNTTLTILAPSNFSEHLKKNYIKNRALFKEIKHNKKYCPTHTQKQKTLLVQNVQSNQ